MTPSKKWGWPLIFLLTLLPFSELQALDSAFSGNYVIPETQSGFTQEQYEVKIAKKFQRGWENFLLGWLEIPQGIKSEFGFREDYQLPAGLESVVLGAFKGFLNGVGRTVVGAYEVLTCVYPQEPIFPEMHEWLY